jgi:hypothetical protein
LGGEVIAEPGENVAAGMMRITRLVERILAVFKI